MNKSLKILFINNATFVFAGSLLGPLYAVFIEGIDDQILSISISWFAFLFSAVIFTYFISLFGDKIKETEYLLVGGYLIRAIAWFSFIFVNSLSFIIFLQVVLGLGEALGNPSFETILAKHLDRGKYINEYSKWKILEKLAGAFGVILGGFIVFKFGFTPLFLTMSLLTLVVALVILFQPRERL